MRLFSSLLVGLALVGTAPVWSAHVGPAHAEDRATPTRVGKVGLRVSEVFPESRQALVIDVATGKRVLVNEGDRVGAYQVIEIGDGEVVVRSGARELVLVASARSRCAWARVLNTLAMSPVHRASPSAHVFCL